MTQGKQEALASSFGRGCSPGFSSTTVPTSPPTVYPVSDPYFHSPAWAPGSILHFGLGMKGINKKTFLYHLLDPNSRGESSFWESSGYQDSGGRKEEDFRRINENNTLLIQPHEKKKKFFRTVNAMTPWRELCLKAIIFCSWVQLMTHTLTVT